LLGSGAATSVITVAQVATIKEGLRGYGGRFRGEADMN
jgi:hypothetical protein